MHVPPDCRHKDRYTAPDRFATEHVVTSLVAALVRATQPDYCVEVGTYQGHTTQAIGEALQENGYGRLDAIEALPNRHAETVERTVGLPVTVHHTDFVEWTAPKGTPVDFAFIDATTIHRERDTRRVLEWARPGATIVIHDTAKEFRTFKLIQPLITEGRMRAVFLPTLRGVAICEVLPHGN